MLHPYVQEYYAKQGNLFPVIQYYTVFNLIFDFKILVFLCQ